jgi:glycosyltransferase involved in cell wall biosynthesis
MPIETLSQARVLLVHEWLYTWAGAERCLEELVALVPHADVLVGVVTPEMRTQHSIARRAAETWVGGLPGARMHHRWFLPLHAVAFRTFDTSRYDLVVSLSHAFEKLIRARTGRHLCYCFSPPRYLWDLYDTYARHASWPQRLALRAAISPLRAIDRAGAAGVDRFVCISRTVAERVRRSYGRESDVVYPPVMAKATPPSGQRENFLLSLGRLVPYKRIDLAIGAAERLGMRLVIAGDGPDRSRLQRLAGAHTELVGQVSEEEAGRLLSTCRAFVFCGEEDFGIAPLEAHAHGTPVVAYGRGGVLETMRDNVDAIFFDRQTESDVVGGIERCLARAWDAMALRQNAARFSPEHFREAMLAILAEMLEPGKPGRGGGAANSPRSEPKARALS